MELKATDPEVGKMVIIGSYDENASVKQIEFVEANLEKTFKILKVGEQSCKIDGVPFHVKHTHIYEAAK